MLIISIYQSMKDSGKVRNVCLHVPIFRLSIKFWLTSSWSHPNALLSVRFLPIDWYCWTATATEGTTDGSILQTWLFVLIFWFGIPLPVRQIYKYCYQKLWLTWYTVFIPWFNHKRCTHIDNTQCEPWHTCALESILKSFLDSISMRQAFIG